MIGEPQELVLSDRYIVTVAEMDCFEIDKADSIVSARTTPVDEKNAASALGEMFLKKTRIYGFCSVRSINGEAVKPLSGVAQYGDVASRFGMKEGNKLAEWAQPIYMPEEEAVKNEPSDLLSE